ncbi:hypothetical protein F0562_027392 [Nyssa sinensis]|uniref:C2 NT-type domain-containing protein n=1 Tax=Nyssa sinensis TaxID=561372 RepID=A0A5J5B5Z6_9ASTE|nr:hypothetical protein F0562_027392 [Nyssa sinensis]
MSRITKWKLEKTKVKVVFRLQFHATHIPLTGWDKLFISFIPTDSGKATAKTTKANVRNGTCKWADPIYETTRLLQDAKIKQFDEKLYKFVVAMGSSRSSILGEASINLADYAHALKPSDVALPLHGCNSGTILHVTIQLLTSKTGFREFEQQREIRERGLQMRTDLNKHDGSGTGKISSSEETTNYMMDKVNARIRFRPKSKELPSLEEEVGLNEEYADSAVGFDGSSNTSESFYAEKHDTSSTHEVYSLKSTVSGDLNGFSHSQSPQAEKGDPSDHRLLAQGRNDWVHGLGSDCSIENDLAISYEENSRLTGNLEVAESSIFELKQEICSLQSHADEIGVDTHKFSQQLAAEIASGEELAREVSLLRSECSKFRDDLERLKNLKLIPRTASRETSNTEQDHLFPDIQLRWLQGLLVVEDGIRELQNKAYLRFHERDFRLLHSDLDSLLGVLQDLKLGTGEAIPLLNIVPSERTNVKDIKEMRFSESEQFISGTGFDVDLHQPECMLHCLSVPGHVSHHSDSIGATNALKSKIFELLRDLDEAKAEKESLARKMDQMECYYEALIQELEENQKQMLGELHNLRNEHSTCMYTIATNQAEMESMRQDIDEQILRFTEERRDFDSLNKELERRAITSEAALKRARLNYSTAVGQLQKDLDLLSFQVLSMFETNENLIKQAFSETPQLCFRGYPDSVQNQDEPNAAKLMQDQNQSAKVKKKILGGNILLEDLKKSLHLQQELYQKVEEELCEMHLVNVHLDVFSKTLQETLLEATAEIILMKEKIDEFKQQLEFLTESKELLILRMQTAMDDVQTLNEDKASFIAKCTEMVLQNQILDAKLESVCNENCLLTEKITEWEELLKEYRSYESKYEACSAKQTELENLIKKETLHNGYLQNEISSLKVELKTVKADYDELSSLKENLQKIVNFLLDKLWSLLASYDKQFNGLSLSSSSLCQDLEFKDCKGVVVKLEEIQHNACEKIVQLMEEKKNLEDERDIAQVSISTAKSEILVLKQKFKHDIQDVVTKLDISNALVERLQLELEAISNKLHVSSEVEEKFTQQNKELFADLSLLELELQQLTSKNGDLAQKILGLDTVTEELGRSKFNFDELMQEKQDLVKSLQDKTEESVKLVSELDRLKESLRFLHDELHVERSFRDKLECTVTDLTSQLNENHNQLLHFAQQKTELAHFRQLASDLELEKSRLAHLLLQHEECQEQLRGESSRLTDLESQLSVVHGYLLSANIEVAFIRTHYETQIEELAQLRQSSDSQLGELHKKYLDVEAMLNCRLASEAHYIEENAKLVITVESLRSELEASIAQNRVLSDSNNVMMVQLEEYKERAAMLEVSFSEEKNQHGLEVGQLKYMLVSSKEEIGDLMSSKEELEITVMVLKAKLDEQLAYITSLEEQNDEFRMLQNQCNELSQRFSEQILKTEQFKNNVRSLRSELEASIAQNRVLSDSNNVMMVQLEEYKERAAMLEVSFSEEKNQHGLEVGQLKYMLVSSEEEIGDLMSSKEELEITVMVLKAKLDEQLAYITSLEEQNDEFMMLQNQCNELSQRFSEQILKTEQFKNLSIHLKELKDKAEAECLQAREKREPEAPSVPMQESLRIVFIKEQYETKLQELRHQLSISQRHGEEMLLKLQDAIDEVENRKKSEASYFKRNEELSLKVLELEAELHSVVSDKREKIKAYDRIKAELECALLSLECCKEEKQKLEACLQECDEEKSRIAVQLTLTKGQLESSASPPNVREEENGGLDKVGHMSGELVMEKAYQENPIADIRDLERITADITGNSSSGNPFPKYLDQDSSLNCEEVDSRSSISTCEGEHSSTLMNLQSILDAVSKGTHGIPKHALLDQEALPHSDSKHLAVTKYHLKAQSLKSSINHLHEELERMKNENTLLLQNDHHFDPNFEGLQRELMQLNKANEELGSMFPLFNEFSGSGNALERVLALEIELAESLQAKKKSSIHFQSSFLKQHSNEEAVFQSFRDINELIQEMLGLKGKYAAVESELEEMHDRYSQLSLQFAEVEGERQKLTMMLKNVRASKKLVNLNPS